MDEDDVSLFSLCPIYWTWLDLPPSLPSMVQSFFLGFLSYFSLAKLFATPNERMDERAFIRTSETENCIWESKMELDLP